MKQTNNAIKFLMAQYRAVFKHAYLKGLVSAAVLTAGLAAGASQAADFWTYSGSASPKWTNQNAYVTGNVETIAGSRQTSGKTAAENGVIVIDAQTNKEASATTITDSIYGGLSNPAEDVIAIARNNDVFIKNGATLTGGGSGSNIIGGKAFAKGTLATALADTNDIVIDAGSNISAINQIIGGHAESINGATAKGNTVSIVTNSSSANLNKSGIYGGMARVTTGSIGGDYVAKGNSVSISGSGANFVTSGSAAGKTIVGGYTFTDSTGSISSLQSLNNSVTLTSGSIGSASDDGTKFGFIAGNYAWNVTSSPVANVIANGSTETGVTIKNSTVHASTIYGGGAINTSGGNVSANNNNVTIIDTDVQSATNQTSLVLGGYAENSNIPAGDTTTMSASSNTITIENNSDTVDKTINAPIFGGSIEVTRTAGNDLSGSIFTASSNYVTIGSDINLQVSNIYGAKVNLDKSGAAVVASNNTVEFGGTFVGTPGAAGEVIGAKVSQVATTSNNSVTINGTISNGLVAGVDLAGTAPSGKFSLAVGNTVTIGKEAELLNTDIWAVKSAHATQVVNSTVTIQGKLTDSNIYGGATDTQNGTSTVSLEQGSSLTLNEATAATKDFIISSDTVKLNGDINVARSDNTLTIQGYITDGVTTGGTFNTNQTEIGSTAKIYNAGKITFYGDTTVASGAALHATSNNSQLIISADKNKYDVDFSSNTVKNLDKVGGTGSLTLSVEQVKSYLSSGDAVPDTISAFEVDTAGNIQVTSGGALKFTDDTVVLSKFDFDDAAPTVGKIQVDSTSGDGGSIFKGKTVVVEHALASNASTAKKPFAPNANTPLDEDLNEITASGVFIEADVLKLGSNNLIQEQSAEIKFAKATAKNEIDFTVKSGDYQLTSEVAGNNYMRTQDLESKLDYYTALNGTINGDVNVITGGKLNIEYGHWTAKDNVTLSESGELTVGGVSPSLTPGASGSIADATLILDKSLTLSVATSTDINNITVTGNGGHNSGIYDYDYAAGTIGDDGLALLDLSNGVSLKTEDVTGDIEGKTTLTVTNGGIIKLNASDLNDILAANGGAANITSGAFFSASGLGVFEVAGDVETTFSDFGGGSAHNGITLSANGYLVADSLSVLAQHDSSVTDSDDSKHTFEILDLGDETGTVVVKDLIISDLQQTTGNKPSGSNSYASKVTFGKGTAYISESLTSNNHTLHLGDASGNTKAHIYLESGLADGEGKVNVTNISIDNGSFNVLGGSWDASSTTFKLSGSGSNLSVYGSGSDENDVDFTPSLVASSVEMGAASMLDIKANGTASFDTANLGNLGAATFTGTDNAQDSGIHVAGTLIINGSETATTSDGKDDPKNGVAFGAEGSIVIDNNGILKFGSLATNGAILADGTYSGSGSVTLATGYSKIENQGGELHLGLASSTTFDGEAVKTLKKSLFTSNSFNGDVLAYGGILNIGDATFNGIKVDKLEGQGLSGYTATWESLKGFSDIYGSDVTNNTLVQTNVSGVKVGDNIQGHWGSISLDPTAANSAQAIIAGNVTLRYAAGNNGFFISNADHSEARGAIVKSQKDLTFIGGGTAGKITLEAGIDDAEKNLTVFKVMDGETTVSAIEGSATGAGIAGATLVEALSNLTVTNDIKNIDEVSALNGSTIKAANGDVNEFNTESSHIAITKELKFNSGNVVGGSVSAEDAYLKNSGELDIAHGGTFTANTLTAEKGGDINVGFDSANESYTLEDGTKLLGTGYLDVGTLETNGATITVDPAYGEKTSVSATLRFKDGKETYAYNSVGTLNGNVHVGANSVFAVGANVADTLDAVATYQSNGSLSKGKYGSILYLNGQMIVKDGSEIALNSDDGLSSDIRDSLKYTITSQELDQYADLGLGTNTAILVTEKAFEDSKGDKTGTAIYFDRKDAVVNGVGGEIVLSGTFDASDKLNIFNDQDDNGVDVKGSIKVLTQNGFLYATLSGDDQGKGVQLEVDKNKAYAVMSEASTPVIESLISYHADRIGQTATETPESEQTEQTIAASEIVAANGVATKAGGANVDTGTGSGSSDNDQSQGGSDSGTGSDGSQTQTPPVATTKVTGNSTFLNEVVNTSHGAPAEAAARLAIYGGAVQSVLAANNSSAELISSRMGVGAQNGALTFADNGQGAGLWVAPLYKSQESDSFGSQGLNYGVDLSMYGLALGGDYTLDNGMRFGAMFNVGSGDADGQGNAAAASTTNDFDYWGFSVYGGYSMDALSIVADLGYTVVDNSLEATTGMQDTTKLTASTDSSALTFGVTAQYKFDFNGLVVAPHAGLRYTNVDLDSYTVKGDEDVAHYNANSMSVFSIPVGVALSKDIVAGSWTVKPSLDLTLTANMGDDSIDGSVTWTGVNNLQTNVESEVLDSFTYGAAVGVAAKTGNFSLGVGLNYTGSSNTDEYGVNANARFVF